MKSFRIQAVLAVSVLLLGAVTAKADEELDKGKTIYNGTGACFSCHGATGEGDGAAAAALNPKPRSFTKGVFNFDTDGDGLPNKDEAGNTNWKFTWVPI